MKKRMSGAFGKKVYLLGKDEKEVYYWLEEPTWDCKHYWGFGYIETYTNNENSKLSRDINSHEHVESFYPKWWGDKKSRLKYTTFSEKEGWELAELFKRFYLFAQLANLYYKGHMGFTKVNPYMKNLKEWERINKVILPIFFKQIIKILTPKEV